VKQNLHLFSAVMQHCSTFRCHSR